MSGGFGALDQVLQGIDAAIAAGLAPIKINTVIERGVNDHTVLDLVEHFRGTPVIVRFIEFMDVGNRNAWRPRHGGPVARAGRRASTRAGRCTRSPRTTAARWRERWRFDDGARRNRLHFLRVAALLRQLHPGPPVLRGQVLYLSVRDPRARSARRRCAAARPMPSCCDLIRGTWRGRADRYSELRDELRRARNPAARRRSRCTTSAAEP